MRKHTMKRITSNYVRKAKEKEEIHRMIQRAMNTPEYKKAREYDMQQATLRGLITFTHIGLAYLELVFRCKRKGLLKFLQFAKKVVDEIGYDEEYIKASNKYYLETHDLDVMDILGVAYGDKEIEV